MAVKPPWQPEQWALGVGLVFREANYLREALTHRSYLNEHRREGARDNERLEFLGDAVLGFCVTTRLWRLHPKASEGELSERRSHIVCESNLAQRAQDLDLGRALRLGRGEEQTGGRRKPRLLASALEALLGAFYLDQGSVAVERWIGEIFFADQSAEF